VAEAMGIDPGWHAHNLRHQFASEEAASGANIADLSETLGHKSPDVTFRRYVRSMPGRLDRMVGRMKHQVDHRPRPGHPGQGSLGQRRAPGRTLARGAARPPASAARPHGHRHQDHARQARGQRR
jgi:hypothetical protein